MADALLVNESLIVYLSQRVIEIVDAVAEQCLRAVGMYPRGAPVHSVGVNYTSGSPVEEYVFPVRFRRWVDQQISLIRIGRIVQVDCQLSDGSGRQFGSKRGSVIAFEYHG